MIATALQKSETQPLFEYQLEHLFSYRIEWAAPPEVIGPTPEGLRVNFHFVGGELRGPRLTGRIRPVGADRLVVRHDGVGILDLRATFETDDGAVIDAPFIGVIDIGENGYDDLLQGKLAPEGTPFRSVPRYQTAHPDYQWLNRLQCLGIGQVYPSQAEARCDVYAVR
jgi:hypothetical protein